MSKRWGTACFLLLAGLFLVVNRAAYQGYFQDDEFDTLSWAPQTPATYLGGSLLSPQFSRDNLRPVPVFFFHEAGLHFGLDFAKYVIVIHLIHLLNVWLIWLVARRCGACAAAAALGCVFFAFHMALFDAVWKPMYIYDVLCATFCLLSLLCFARRQWILSFIAYWMAYKSKELAVMLPVALACYEIWFGKRRWKPLVPFFLASLSFGLQGLLLNPNKDNEYSFHFTPEALGTTAVYYASRVLLIPYLGFVVPAVALLARNRRTWFGLALMGSLFLPLLFLPGRLFSAYCYAPFAGLAIMLAGVVETSGALPVALLLLAWIPADLRELRTQRNVTLARDTEIRQWVAGVKQFAATGPQFDAVAWSGKISGFAPWGVLGALSIVLHRWNLQVHYLDFAEPSPDWQKGRVAYLLWNASARQLSAVVHTGPVADVPYIRLSDAPGVWQLGQGWNDLNGGHRWTGPTAEARFPAPSGLSRFRLCVVIPPDQLAKAGPLTFQVLVNGESLGDGQFAAAGEGEAQWTLPAAPTTPVTITLRAVRPYQPTPNGGFVGLAVRSFGFVRE